MKEKIKQKLTARLVTLKLTGLFFAAYSAYNLFIVIRDSHKLSEDGKIISQVVALLFGVLTMFTWTSEIKDLLFLKLRVTVFIAALFGIFMLKLRMADDVVDYMSFSKIHTLIYGASYFLTLAAMMLLFINYAYILKRLPFFPRASIAVPVIAIALFFISLALETILFLVYAIGLEASATRTIVMRPVFYFACIGLAA